MNTKNYGKDRLNVIAKIDNQWLAEAEWNQANKYWLDKSKRIAVKILRTLREKGISQSDLAEKMDISRQMVSKLVQGKENMTLSTICNLERALGADLFEYIITGSVELEISPQHALKPATMSKIKNLSGSEDYNTPQPLEYNETKRFILLEVA